MFSKFDKKYADFITSLRVEVKDFINTLTIKQKISLFEDNQFFCPFSRYNIYCGYNYVFSVKYRDWSNEFTIISKGGFTPVSYNTFLDILTDIYISMTSKRFLFYK